MIDCGDNSERDDLSEFTDYLAEFNSMLNFDDETCPVCGINVSQSISEQKSPFVEFKSVKTESDLTPIIGELELKGVPFKIEKHLNPDSTSEINYNFVLLVPFRCLTVIKEEKV